MKTYTFAEAIIEFKRMGFNTDHLISLSYDGDTKCKFKAVFSNIILTAFINLDDFTFFTA